MTTTEQWAISSDEENYGHITFDSKDEAIAEGRALYDGETFYVGRCVPPPPPECYFHSSDWLENVCVQDLYSGDHAEYWEQSTKAQRDELDLEVRTVLSAWLDRHNLRPTFFNMEDVELIIPHDEPTES